MTSNVIMIIFGILLIFIAIKLFKKVTKLIFFILVLAGIYSFSKGLVDIGTLLNWWGSII